MSQLTNHCWPFAFHKCYSHLWTDPCCATAGSVWELIQVGNYSPCFDHWFGIFVPNRRRAGYQTATILIFPIWKLRFLIGRQSKFLKNSDFPGSLQSQGYLYKYWDSLSTLLPSPETVWGCGIAVLTLTCSEFIIIFSINEQINNYIHR